MILAIDIGNTNIVLGCIRDDEILFEARMATDLLKTADEYCAGLHSILFLNHFAAADISGCIISSVVPPVLNALCTAVKRLTGHDPMIVGPGIKTGLNVRTDDPAEVGGDLITAAVAAVKEYGAPLLIVDMGTATTISAIDEKGAYLGGCICPGLRISQEALTNRTSQLPGIRLEMPKKAIGRNTVDCMRSGIMIGAAAMLDGLLERMQEELGTEAKIIATGGMVHQILPLCRKPMIYDENLLLKGLNILYKNNMK